jgi:hypothetical protein
MTSNETIKNRIVRAAVLWERAVAERRSRPRARSYNNDQSAQAETLAQAVRDYSAALVQSDSPMYPVPA